MKESFLFVGLGNVGKQYQWTRHNAGFLAIDFLTQQCQVSFHNKSQYALGQASIQDKTCFFLKPLQLMNLSGYAVKEVSHYYKIPSSHILVIYDEMAFDLGAVRLKFKGSSGGHNGVQSIIQELGTDQFMRLRIGIHSSKASQNTLSHFVLSSFTSEEKKFLDQEVFPKIVDIFETFLKKGLAQTMGIFNGA